MAEGGMSPEVQKIGFGQRMKEFFTRQGATEKLLRNSEAYKKYADVNNGLTDEQRAQALTQLEAAASDMARVQVRNRWGATAVGLAVATGAGLGIWRPEWVAKIANANLKVFGKERNVGKIFKPFAKGAEKANDFLTNIWDRAGKLKLKLGKKEDVFAHAEARGRGL